jgi:glycine cleavage system H protein
MKFTSTHEWVEKENDIAKVGITDFAANELGDIVFIQLPEIGDMVTVGEPFAEVESVKAVEPINSPVTGKIVEINEKLMDSPEVVNEAAFDSWFVKVEVEAEGNLLTEDEYKALLV